eukprot:CAMPEP_0206466892 /NCGR_PEP_ID=MMETSP0324_2-20121206/28724_1 /ASSEMBLY_ACC=CAM_ASM_000836 /TAXON_ID=2866 /ORGANISM="Crypthecodinium cohnii, Strain Seligo" /LENGTH=85 /DNA_ID=CAMNT_0053940085 /DNA_START=524 /DNA_END=777 /DNA_ORIENTATION=+
MEHAAYRVAKTREDEEPTKNFVEHLPSLSVVRLFLPLGGLVGSEHSIQRLQNRECDNEQPYVRMPAVEVLVVRSYENRHETDNCR